MSVFDNFLRRHRSGKGQAVVQELIDILYAQEKEIELLTKEIQLLTKLLNPPPIRAVTFDVVF
jgi:hypothetical protein